MHTVSTVALITNSAGVVLQTSETKVTSCILVARIDICEMDVMPADMC